MIFSLFLKHDVTTFQTNSIHLGHSIALIVLGSWILQIISGFLLLGVLAWSIDVQYVDLIGISAHGNFVFLLRSLHMLGANVAMVSLIVHACKGVALTRIISTTKLIIWFSGSVIFLFSLATAFTGYVVVSGNMSYWAALVILNLLTVIPIIGDELVNGILGGATMSNYSLRRFTVIHFGLAILAAAMVLFHLLILHRQSPNKFSYDINDGRENLFVVLTKDMTIILILLGVIFFSCVFDLVHPDNWNQFSRLATPSHIEPEIYFLWTFAIIKLHSGKLIGSRN